MNKTKKTSSLAKKAREAEKQKFDNARTLLATTYFDFATAQGVVRKKVAYIRYNRPIDEAKVRDWMVTVREGKYVSYYPIIVADAVDFHNKNPHVTIVDASGNEIAVEELGEYVVVLDGQHRSCAHMILTIYGEYTAEVPGVVVVDDITDVAGFLLSVNPGNSWSNNEKGIVSALAAPQKYQPLCQFISAMVAKGMNRSTASFIVMRKFITSKQINHLLAGKEPKNSIDFNIPRGLKFIELCDKAGITMKYLTKRYFIEGYHAYAISTSEEQAEKALANIGTISIDQLKGVTCKDDFKIMLENANIHE